MESGHGAQHHLNSPLGSQKRCFIIYFYRLQDQSFLARVCTRSLVTPLVPG
jgi:hypothetical protein